MFSLSWQRLALLLPDWLTHVWADVSASYLQLLCIQYHKMRSNLSVHQEGMVDEQQHIHTMKFCAVEQSGEIHK